MSYKIAWSDISFSDGRKLEHEHAILNAILFLSNISKGEILFRPYIGSDIDNYLFDPIDEFTAERILDTLIETIETFDPRIKVVRSQSEVIPVPDERMFLCNITILELTGNRYAVEFPIYSLR